MENYIVAVSKEPIRIKQLSRLIMNVWKIEALNPQIKQSDLIQPGEKVNTK